MPPETTEQKLEKVQAAIATGAMEVRFEDRTVKFRSQSELLALERRYKRELGQGTGARRRKATFETGL